MILLKNLSAHSICVNSSPLLQMKAVVYVSASSSRQLDQCGKNGHGGSHAVKNDAKRISLGVCLKNNDDPNILTRNAGKKFRGSETKGGIK